MGFQETHKVSTDNHLFDGLVARQLAFEKQKPTVIELANQFETLVRSSGAFSWSAMILEETPYRGRTLDVYLSTRTGTPSDCPADVVETFCDLALFLEPYIIANLHLVENVTDSRQHLEKKSKEVSMGGSPDGRTQLLIGSNFYFLLREYRGLSGNG